MDTERLEKALKANCFGFRFFKGKDELIDYLRSAMPAGSSAAVGGSVTLSQLGVLDMLRSGEYDFHDRYREGADVERIFHESYSVDFYLASANAITEHGEIYLVDGTSNRTSAILYGPRKVFLIAGTNKVVGNLSEAVSRVKRIAAPENAKRLGIDTYCSAAGECRKTECDRDDLMCSFSCGNTICCNTVVLSRQRAKERIEVLLVDGSFGY